MKIKDKNVVIDLFNKNLSQKKIGELLNVKQSRISDIVRELGLKRDKSLLNLNKLKLDINYFKNIDDYHKAYWLGFICADGSINKQNNKMTLVSKDKENIEKFKEDIKSEHTISEYDYFDKRTNKYYKRYIIQITTKPFVMNIIKHGVTNNKTNELIFPEISEELYSYFIAGLFDGDGGIVVRNDTHYLSINLISTKELLIKIQDYLYEKFNISYLKLKKVTERKNNVYKMFLYKDAFKFLDFIYNKNNKELYLQRKYTKYEENNK